MYRYRPLIAKSIIFALLLFHLPLFAQQAATFKYVPPEKLNDGIRTGTLKDSGLDEAKIVAGTNEILKGTYPNIHSLLIFRNGRLVYENYFTGEDVDRGAGPIGIVKHTRDTLHDMRSVTKSIVGTAVMLAHAQGKIKSLDQPVFDFFPEYAKYADGDKKNITVKHLLTMRAGLEWNERIPYTDPANSEIKMNRSTNPIEFVLSQKLVARPGTVFNYSGGTTQVLAEIVKKATGLPIDEYTAKNLFAPLGITTFIWVKDRNGFPSAASGLRLRSRDMAKIGMLLMNKGRWNGKRIIPAKLADEAMAEHVKLIPEDTRPGDIEGYGYQVWRLSTPINSVRSERVEFSGNGGQKVQIDTANQLMVVVTAGNYNKRGLKKSSFHIYEDIVYPALLDRKPARKEKVKAATP
ncbi:serine hydrolase [soil metagenome]